MLLFCSSFVALRTPIIISDEPALSDHLLSGLRSYLFPVCKAILGTNHLLSTDGLICIILQYRNNLVTKMHICSFPFGFLNLERTCTDL